jgi:hypothetical protein
MTGLIFAASLLTNDLASAESVIATLAVAHEWNDETHLGVPTLERWRVYRYARAR